MQLLNLFSVKHIHLKVFLILLYQGIIGVCHGQVPSDSSAPVTLQDIVIIDTLSPTRQTTRSIYTFSHRQMKETGAITLADALSHIPGVYQIFTGPIAKPVIRGVSGNRLQINLGGVRLEDQQWEDEQGLGLSEVGVQRVEIIKGPGALLYGADAIGAVIRIIDDEADSLGQEGLKPYLRQHLNTEFFANTRGVGIDYGLKARPGTYHQWMANASIENHADYSDGHGSRAPNTRFDMYNLKLGHHFKKGKWSSENRLYTSFNRFGFLKDSAEIIEAKDEPRWEREFEGEHHSILSLVITSNNSYALSDKTEWSTLIGWQSNNRKEQEGENTTELGLTLNTLSLKSTIQTKLNRNLLINTGIASMIQNNNNTGSRRVIPDAGIKEIGCFSYFKKTIPSPQWPALIESGIRFDIRHIDISDAANSSVTGLVNKSFGAFNYALGGSLSHKSITVKGNLSTGFRYPNLAELYSNGQHEGIARWDRGDSKLKKEFSINKELTIEYRILAFSWNVTLFTNKIENYIYITPGTESFNGFPVYRYIQNPVKLKGLESAMEWSASRNLSLSLNYAYLQAKNNEGQWLPFIPAARVITKVNWKVFRPIGFFQNISLFGSATYSASQHKVYPGEKTSPAYWLISPGISTDVGNFHFLVTCSNLTNTYYNDHLSLLRTLGIRDMGRNLVLSAGYSF